MLCPIDRSPVFSAIHFLGVVDFCSLFFFFLKLAARTSLQLAIRSHRTFQAAIEVEKLLSLSCVFGVKASRYVPVREGREREREDTQKSLLLLFLFSVAARSLTEALRILHNCKEGREEKKRVGKPELHVGNN